MKFLVGILFVCPLVAQTEVPAVTPYSAFNLMENRHFTRKTNFAEENDGKILYKWSLAAVAAGNAADVLSSWHRPEANPLLSTPGSDFNGRSVALKAVLVGATVLAQRYVLSRNPNLARRIACLNFTLAGGLVGAAAYNTSLR